MIEADFYQALGRHLAEYDALLRRIENPPKTVIIQCSVCGTEGVQGKQIIFDLKLAQWQCKESWPCEGDGAWISETEKRIEEVQELEPEVMV